MPCSQMMSMNCNPPRPTEDIRPARLPSPNDAERNSLMSTIGSATRNSMKQNATSSSSPAVIAPSTHGLVQPVVAPPYGWMPYVMPVSSAVSPTANVSVPAQSSCPGVRTPSSFSERMLQTVPSTPIGTPTQKMARQSNSESTPPISRPRNEPATAATMLTPSAMPRWFDGNASVRIAADDAINIAPPTP